MDVSIFEIAGQALLHLLSWQYIFYLLSGVVIGLSVGLLPGLGGIAGLSLILPFIFTMDQGPALAMMVGLTAVTTTSDTFPAVLIGIPGSSGSQATVVDGFPLSKKGEGARALAAAFSASLCGGLLGALMLSFAFVVAQPVLMAVGFGEQLMLVLLALTFVGMLTGPSMLKGLAACGIGLLLGTVGTATVTAQLRMTLGSEYLIDGIPLVIMGLGLFAIPEILDVLRHQQAIASREALGSGWLQGVRDVIRHRWLVLRCSLLGAAVGALPGLGGTVVDWIAYGHTLQSSKDHKNFGKGDIRGVIGPESANNAKEGGALMPTMFLGIPGSGTMALLLGAFVVIGITPGRDLVTHHADLIYLVIWSLALANVAGALVCIGLSSPITKLTTIRYSLIAPFMLVVVFFAAFQATRSWGDLVALVVLGMTGSLMKRFGWPRAALLIGFVLSGSLEDAVYRTVQIYGFDVLLRPVALTLLALAVITLFFVLRARGREGGSQEGATKVSARKRAAQIIFTLALAIFVGMVLADARHLSFLAYVFPVSVAIFTGAVIVIILGDFMFRKESPRLFYDSEAELKATDSTTHPASFYFGLFVLLPLLSSIIGFFLAAPIYVATFLRTIARTSWTKSLLSALIVMSALWLLGDMLVLRYPEGWLPQWVSFHASHLKLALL